MITRLCLHGIPTGSCTLFQYQCDNGNCVMGSDVCNGQDNCGDNSDETQCGRSKYNDARWSIRVTMYSGPFVPAAACSIEAS